MKNNPCRLVMLLLAIACAMAASCVRAEIYPARPVQLVVPYPAGGVTDVLARALAQGLTRRWEQTVYVDNRGGASGNIGSNLVAKASADGYTLLFGTASTHTINPALFANLPFDPVRDFVPISLVAQIPNVLLVHPSLGVHSVQELIALARKKPGSLDYASSGNGTTTHLAGELFKMRTGVDIVHVPYTGSSAAIQDLVAGRISIMFENLPIGLKWVTAGRLIPLAVTGITRSPALPDVPTMQESGVADFNVTGWSGVFAPAATPPAIVAQIAESISEVMGVPAMREAFNANGAEVVASTPEQFSRQIKAEMAGWISVVRASGAKVD